jgi:hypothetical protein
MDSSAIRPSLKIKTYEVPKFWVKMQEVAILSKMNDDD